MVKKRYERRKWINNQPLKLGLFYLWHFFHYIWVMWTAKKLWGDKTVKVAMWLPWLHSSLLTLMFFQYRMEALLLNHSFWPRFPVWRRVWRITVQRQDKLDVVIASTMTTPRVRTREKRFSQHIFAQYWILWNSTTPLTYQGQDMNWVTAASGVTWALPHLLYLNFKRHVLLFSNPHPHLFFLMETAYTSIFKEMDPWQ